MKSISMGLFWSQNEFDVDPESSPAVIIEIIILLRTAKNIQTDIRSINSIAISIAIVLFSSTFSINSNSIVYRVCAE
ncbi:MAG: hypothetical protein J07HQW2_03525 [Haloquadratum walsbyi J07HQW2]|uniref:Uncharacterized protein n=1 Tax=Haloquadratum walsbyi J07HQW2 TaxID=1238425 RepID=U1N2D5_9EURY|nr:MAG: hypothetical protein J07HQW2_03525 [Haloquadratum walsbyi J07HQW2]